MRTSIATMRANKHREGGETRTHHLTELDGRLAHLIPNPNRDLGGEEKESSSVTHLFHQSQHTISHVAGAQKRVAPPQRCGCNVTAYAGDGFSRTSLSIFTLALRPSMASSF